MAAIAVQWGSTARAKSFAETILVASSVEVIVTSVNATPKYRHR